MAGLQKRLLPSLKITLAETKMKKGLLIFPIMKDLNKADGVVIKNQGICKGFAENGVDIDELEFNSSGVFLHNKMLVHFPAQRFKRILEYHFKVWERLSHLIGKFKYDFIWFRMPIANPFIARFVAALKKENPACKIIIEYGAYPFVNELSGVRKYFYKLNRRAEKKIHANADFVITYSGQKDIDGVTNIPVNNGIDLSGIPVVHHRDVPSEINFISVSSLKKWHAYERFITGMSDYFRQDGVQPIHFHVVGNGPEYDKLFELSKQLNLQDRITFHNHKTGKELDVIYNLSHIAVGTLGFHRIGITNSSSLKNREYFARGLPIVLSTTDLDMPDELAFVKYVPEGEEPVNITEVVEFARSIYQLPSLNSEVRTYAEENVSWKGKIKTVLNYLVNKNDAVAMAGRQSATGS
jgi:glycosyltransferase involved in cell wall biosynthesis